MLNRGISSCGLNRRSYQVASPVDLWHIDDNQKLIRYQIQSMIVKLIRLKNIMMKKERWKIFKLDKKLIIHFFVTCLGQRKNIKNDKCWNSSKRKVWMSKLKLIIPSLSLWFSNQRGWWGQEGGSPWKEVGKGKVHGREKSLGWGNLENLRNILGQREWNYCRKGRRSESQRYFKWEVHTPCPSPPPPNNLGRGDPWLKSLRHNI